MLAEAVSLPQWKQGCVQPQLQTGSGLQQRHNTLYKLHVSRGSYLVNFTLCSVEDICQYIDDVSLSILKYSLSSDVVLIFENILLLSNLIIIFSLSCLQETSVLLWRCVKLCCYSFYLIVKANVCWNFWVIHSAFVRLKQCYFYFFQIWLQGHYRLYFLLPWSDAPPRSARCAWQWMVQGKQGVGLPPPSHTLRPSAPPGRVWNGRPWRCKIDNSTSERSQIVPVPLDQGYKNIKFLF